MPLIVTGNADQIMEMLAGPRQQDEHVRGWRWKQYVADDKKRWDSVKSEFRKMHPTSNRTLEEILEPSE
jgi:hypothetical protein